jgi:hypothetical protein
VTDQGIFEMNIVKITRGLGTFPRLAAAFNVVMVVAVGLVLVLTEMSWSRCLADVDAGFVPLRRCQEQVTNGQASIFFLLVPLWILGDLAFAAVWLWKRRSAGIRSAPASWAALGLSVAGFLTILKLGNLFPFPYLLTAPGVVAGFIAKKQSERTGRRDELAVAGVAIGCVGVVVGVGMWMTA